MFFRRHRAAVLLGLLVLLLVISGWSIATGAVNIAPAEILQFLRGEKIVHGAVLWELRLPRVLMAMLIGGTISVCGVLVQGLFRNPLADPGLVGVSSGAALGAVSLIVLAGVVFPELTWMHDLRLLPWAAFIGAAVVCVLVQRIGSVSGRTSIARLLLTGVAINSLVEAIIGFCTFLSNDAQLRTFTFWRLGSLGGAGWQSLATIAPFCLTTLLLAPRSARVLNALSLGEAEASHLGFNVERSRRWMIFLLIIGVGSCVAISGIIGFLGLVVPHVMRLWIGPDHRWLIPGSTLLGALLLTMADTFSRVIAAPAELPIGIVTAVFGTPVFLTLLWHQRKQLRWV